MVITRQNPARGAPANQVGTTETVAGAMASVIGLIGLLDAREKVSTFLPSAKPEEEEGVRKVFKRFLYN